jgi:hypothetical protein
MQTINKILKVGNVVFSYMGVKYNGRILKESYPSGNDKVSLEIRTAWKKWEKFTNLSCEDENILLPPQIFLGKTTGQNKGLLEALEGQGITKLKKEIKSEGKVLSTFRWTSSIERKKWAKDQH